ncbi:MAG: toxin-antitoxin system YwqK family antitoxin, partial [Bacteroidota bacterium]
QRQWYRSGALFKELHLVEGREDGLQRAWRENGDLYSNYEARDSRIYGLRRATLCYELDDEQITFQTSQP